MTKDEICNLLGWPASADPASFDLLRRVMDVVDEAARRQREACAKLVEDYCGAWDDQGFGLAAAIRARGDKEKT